MAQAADRKRPQATSRQPSDLTSRALQLIEERACQPGFRLDHIAAVLHRSESRVEHLLTLETGLPFKAHVVAFRLKEAMGHLRDRALSVKEAAAKVDWASKTLIAHIRFATGLTPGQWRKREWARERRRSSPGAASDRDSRSRIREPMQDRGIQTVLRRGGSGRSVRGRGESQC